MLKGCQRILEDLDSLIEKFNNLASTNRCLVFQEVRIGTEDITALGSRLVSNTGSLNGFIQRSNIPTYYLYEVYYANIYLYFSCESHEMREMQVRVADAPGLHRSNSFVGTVLYD